MIEVTESKIYNIKYLSGGKKYENLFGSKHKELDKLATYINIDSRANWTWAGDSRMMRIESINSAFSYRSTSVSGSVVYEIIGDSKEDIEAYLKLLTNKGINHINIDKPEGFHND
tara:strand:+ start:1298 stop:1642 length:345 start_codon:yes stop_codon:yes gene_type:complete